MKNKNIGGGGGGGLSTHPDQQTRTQCNKCAKMQKKKIKKIKH